MKITITEVRCIAEQIKIFEGSGNPFVIGEKVTDLFKMKDGSKKLCGVYPCPVYDHYHCHDGQRHFYCDVDGRAFMSHGNNGELDMQTPEYDIEIPDESVIKGKYVLSEMASKKNFQAMDRKELENLAKEQATTLDIIKSQMTATGSKQPHELYGKHFDDTGLIRVIYVAGQIVRGMNVALENDISEDKKMEIAISSILNSLFGK